MVCRYRFLARGPALLAALVFLVVGAAAGLVALFAVVVWRNGPDAGDSRADASNPELVALGAAVYVEHCASCHGERLEGEPNWRRRKADGTLPAPPHDATGHTWHHSDDLLFRLTRDGPTDGSGERLSKRHAGLWRHPERSRDLGRARVHQESVARRHPQGSGCTPVASSLPSTGFASLLDSPSRTPWRSPPSPRKRNLHRRFRCRPAITHPSWRPLGDDGHQIALHRLRACEASQAESQICLA